MKHNKGEVKIKNLNEKIKNKEVELHDLKARMDGGKQKQTGRLKRRLK